MSYKEAGVIMHKSESQITKLIYRGKQRLLGLSLKTRVSDMKTTEERMKLISQRTDELKKEIKIKENLKKRRTVSAGCMAACIMIVVCAGALMPSLIKTAENGDVTYRYGAASVISEAPAAGYVIMGLMSFALGVCPDSCYIQASRC